MIGWFCGRVAAFTRRRGIDPRVQSRRGHSRATVPQWVAAFARRKRRKAAGGKSTWTFPRTPSCFLAAVRAAAMRGGSGCRGFSEFPPSAEGILCKIAARAPLRVVLQPQGLVGTAETRGLRKTHSFSNQQIQVYCLLTGVLFSLQSGQAHAIMKAISPPEAHK